jgi:hypothetical protein
VTLRRQRLTGAQIARDLAVSPVTVSRALRRYGLSRMRDLEPPVPVQRYERDVRLVEQGGRSRKPVPDQKPREAEAVLTALPWRRVTWRQGTKGALSARFAITRVRVGDGLVWGNNRHLPGDEATPHGTNHPACEPVCRDALGWPVRVVSVPSRTDLRYGRDPAAFAEGPTYRSSGPCSGPLTVSSTAAAAIPHGQGAGDSGRNWSWQTARRAPAAARGR